MEQKDKFINYYNADEANLQQANVNIVNNKFAYL